MTDLKTPAIVVNFKAYREVDGEGSLKLAKICGVQVEDIFTLEEDTEESV